VPVLYDLFNKNKDVTLEDLDEVDEVLDKGASVG
jgi:hypothetical protein